MNKLVLKACVLLSCAILISSCDLLLPDNESEIVLDKCKVHKNAIQSISNNTYSTLSFSSEVYDTNDMHHVSINNERVIIKNTGYYIISATVSFGQNGNGERRLYVTKNNSSLNFNPVTIDLLAENRVLPYSNADTYAQVFCSVYLEENEYVSLAVYQNSGSSIDIIYNQQTPTEFSVTKIQ